MGFVERKRERQCELIRLEMDKYERMLGDARKRAERLKSARADWHIIGDAQQKITAILLDIEFANDELRRLNGR